jgi:hypothetical protein
VRRVALVALVLSLLAVPSSSLAGEPPNPHDPCSTAGRDTCGTTGVGFYDQSPYGIRWFGDYRGAAPDTVQTFCIDLGFWYPAARYKYRPAATDTLRNREGELVSASDRQRIAYSVWTYGRTNDPKRQAAVMLYVHSLMGDARPHEVDPAKIDAALVPLVAAISSGADRYHGPYRIVADLQGKLVPGTTTTATVRVLAVSGAALPNQALAVTAQGASAPRAVVTDAAGLATLKLTPVAAGKVAVSFSTTTASTLPTIYAPTVPAAARNGQRLAAPASQSVHGTLAATAEKAKIGLSSEASPATLLAGAASRDKITVTGPLHGPVAWRAYGPFPNPGAISCDGTAVAQGSFTANGAGTYMTAPATFAQPGLYVYEETVVETAAHTGAVTPCTDPGERVRAEVQPTVHTTVSSARVEAGAQLTDQITVNGLAAQPATVQASLYGPFPARDALDCKATAIWTGSVPVTADAQYTTAPFTVQTPGYYVYQESIAAQGFVRAVQTQCADVAETSIVLGHPLVVTSVSTQKTRPGVSIVDHVGVSGLGVLAVQVRAVLWGPFASRGRIACSGAPVWSGSFLAKGDGKYTTAPVELQRAGYYVYQESIAQGEANTAYTAPCAQTPETTVALAAPKVQTVASDDVILPGTGLSDRIQVTGLGKTAAAIDVQLFGPFATRAAVRCAGTPAWSGRVYAQGDGEVHSPAVRLERVGFYTFRETLVGTPLVGGVTTPCLLAVETSLVRPEIITGRGDVTRTVRTAARGGETPARLRLARLGIDAPVGTAGIDIPNGVLAVTPNIHRTAWWADGAAPGDPAGSVLIAGHKDSAAAGAGALFSLQNAHAGDRIEVDTADGHTHVYRVVSVKTYPKKLLPADVYSLHGRPRLEVVTCGGPFDTSIGHYRDNVVLTAVPE